MAPAPVVPAPVVPAPVVPDPMVPDPVVAAGVALLEADLLERGYLAAPALVRHLHRLDTDTLTTHGGLLLTDLDAVLGADRPHVPLFHGFPRSTPKNTRALFVDRILALITQRPEQPCVLCGQLGTVSALSPCGHLVCRQCFDGADYSACPICRERIDVDDPFLRPTPRLSQESTRALPDRARMLTASADPRTEAHAELASLLARTAAPTPQDLDDLSVLLGTRSRTELGWVPEQLPSREVKAVVLAWLLDDPDIRAVTLPEVTTRLDTATDVLRVLAVRSGGDPGLTSVPRLAAVPRPVRRALLAALDRVPPATLVEDLGRHRTLWVHAAERLHPFEYARRFPTAAAAFAVLRRTPLPRTGPVAEAVAAAGFPVSGGRATSYGFGHAVEQALAAPDVPEAVRLLTGRPGEFLRRLDHLLRVGVAADRAGAPGTGSEGGTPAPGDTREPGDAPAAADAPGGGTPQGTGPAVAAVLSALPAALPTAAPAVLVSALGALRVRGIRHPYRVFFPAGRTANTHVIPDDRPALPVPLITR
ncbi:MAG: RING-HC finger protein, partial [Kineosporiaceae bacterium]